MLALLSLLVAFAAPLSAEQFHVPAGPVTVSPDDAGFGPKDAAKTLVVYTDFQCPHCAASYRSLSRLAASHPDVRVAFKHYPISSECNSQVDSARHEHACAAARAGVCAADQGKFTELARLFYLNQAFLAPEDIDFMARQAGLNVKRFDKCEKKSATDKHVRADIASGVAAGIEGTPTFFMRGPWGDRWVRADGYEAAFAAFAAQDAGTPVPEPTPATAPGASP